MSHVNPNTPDFQGNPGQCPNPYDWCYNDYWSFHTGAASMFYGGPNTTFLFNSLQFGHLTVEQAYQGLYVPNANANNLATYAQLTAGNPNVPCSGFYQYIYPNNYGYTGCKWQSYTNYVDNSTNIGCPWFQNEVNNAYYNVETHIWGPTYPNIVLTPPWTGYPGIQYCSNPNASVGAVGWCKSWFYQFARKVTKLHFMQVMHASCGPCNPLVDPPDILNVTLVRDPDLVDPVLGVKGCKDSAATNYDPAATLDCVGVLGGTDTSCCNYVPMVEPINGTSALSFEDITPDQMRKDLIATADLITRVSKNKKGKKIVAKAMEDFRRKYPPSNDQIYDWTSEEDDKKLIEYYKDNTNE